MVVTTAGLAQAQVQQKVLKCTVQSSEGYISYKTGHVMTFAMSAFQTSTDGVQLLLEKKDEVVTVSRKTGEFTHQIPSVRSKTQGTCTQGTEALLF